MPWDETQTLSNNVGILRGIDMRSVGGGKFCVAEVPCKPGLQPLLLVDETPNGAQVFQDVLAVLPQWEVPFDLVGPSESALYKAALGRIRAFHRTTITALKKNPCVLGCLPGQLIDGRHQIDNAPVWLQDRLISLRDEAVGSETPSSLRSQLERAADPERDSTTGVTAWTPLCLISGELRNKNDVDWLIVDMWHEWETKRMDQTARYNDFMKKYPLVVPGCNTKKFRDRVYHLGLSVPAVTGKRKRRKKGYLLRGELKGPRPPQP